LKINIAAGFRLRLQGGGPPIADIPVKRWSAPFALGLAYYLYCLKGLHAKQHELDRPHRFAMGEGAGVAANPVNSASMAGFFIAFIPH